MDPAAAKALLVRQGDAIAAASRALSQAPSWLPVGEPLGCGSMGCVFDTDDPQVVVKMTYDDTEYEFARYLYRTLAAPITVAYHHTMVVVDEDDQRVYLIWRQRADDVGRLYEAVPAGDLAYNLVHEQAYAGTLAYHRLVQYERGGYARSDLKHARSYLETWEVACRRMGADARVPELWPLASGILRVYREQRIFFGDAHVGNLGRVSDAHGLDRWVITDPGGVAVLGAAV